MAAKLIYGTIASLDVHSFANVGGPDFAGQAIAAGLVDEYSGVAFLRYGSM